jgi:hypothetical protein
MAVMIALLVPPAALASECVEDKQKFCKDVIETKGDMGACLKQHAAELSEACKAKREAKAKEKGECKDDKAKFCKDVAGDVRDCLNQHAAELSEACKAHLEARKKAPKEKSNDDATPKADTNTDVPSDDGTIQ